MNPLQKFNIHPSTGADFLLHTQKTDCSDQEFFEEGKELLFQMKSTLIDEVIPELQKYKGTWHPSGFLTYSLGTHTKFGNLRFHVWPKNLRRRLVKGRGCLGEIYDGDIHNHAWNIVSLVIEYYEDMIFEVESVEASLAEDLFDQEEIYRIFNVTYGENAYQALEATGKLLRATPAQKRTVKSGDFHTIDTTIYHAPTVPEDILGATFVFSSFRTVEAGPDVLIRGTSEPILGERTPATTNDTEIVKTQLLRK